MDSGLASALLRHPGMTCLTTAGSVAEFQRFVERMYPLPIESAKMSDLHRVVMGAPLLDRILEAKYLSDTSSA
jgi:hypothetical protein